MSTIPPPLRALLDVFASDFADVQFGTLDAQVLARAATDVEAAEEVLGAAEAAVELARSTLLQRKEILMEHAHRALAYARVYAENDDALRMQLEAIALPRTGRRARSDGASSSSRPASSSGSGSGSEQGPRRPGRPRKPSVSSEPDSAPLSS